MAHKVNSDVCIACGACAGACPVEAIDVSDFAKIDPDKCLDCGTCVDQCPVEAISAD